MDIISSRDVEIARLALGGLAKRQDAIASNVANVMTPGYQRKEVSFEDQLQNILEREELRKKMRAYNSSLDANTNSDIIPNKGFIPVIGQNNALSPQQLKFLSENDYERFAPEVLQDFSKFDVENDNNVDLEKEMTDMAKNGIKYNVLTNLESRAFTNLSEIIRSGG